MVDAGRASLDALRRIRADFEAASKEFPRLYYASIRGEGVKNGGVCFPQADGTYRSLEDYLKSHIAGGADYSDSVGWKWPRYFFFGDDLSGLTRFETLAELLNKVIRDGLHAVKQKVGSGANLEGGLLPEHWHLLGENQCAHEWMFWMMFLAQQCHNPLLTPVRKAVEFADLSGCARAADLPDVFSLWVPAIRGTIGFRFERKNMTREQWSDALPPWGEILECAKSGWLEEVIIFNTSVFYASVVAVDELLALATGTSESPIVSTKMPIAIPLTDSQRDVLQVIAAQRPGEGMSGKQIIAAMGNQMDISTLTRHIIPALKPHGVKNRRGLGYYIESR